MKKCFVGILWVKNWLTGSALKKKPPGGVRTVSTPENTESVGLGIASSPYRPALGISDHSVRWILHLKLTFILIR